MSMSDLHLYRFGVYGIVFLVGADELHIDRLVMVSNRDHQPVVVALDVEHHAAILEDARASILLLDLGGLHPRGLLGFINPRLEWLLGSWVLFPESAEKFDGNDVHGLIIVPFWDMAAIPQTRLIFAQICAFSIGLAS